MEKNWKCPYCNSYNLLDRNYTKNDIELINDIGWNGEFKDRYYNKENKMLLFHIECVVCLNPECKEYTIEAKLLLDNFDDPSSSEDNCVDDTRCIKTWSLLPDDLSKTFPDYIPKVILDDYKEACLIKDKSPKASATLARRCLQGIIRDFWTVKPDTLYNEINQIKDKIDSELYDAINAIRQVGNIGAHMEKDINVIIDVDPNEAQVLIVLIEMLIEEWYIKDHERKERLAKIKEIGIEKKTLKKS